MGRIAVRNEELIKLKVGKRLADYVDEQIYEELVKDGDNQNGK